MVDTDLPPNIALPPRRHQATNHESRTARSLPPPAQSQHQSRSLAPETTSRPATRPAKLIIREAELHKASLHWPPCITTKIVGLAGHQKGGDPLAVLNHDDQDEEHEVAGPCQMVTKATSITETKLNRPNSSRLGIHKQHSRPRSQCTPRRRTPPLQAVNHNHTREQPHSPSLPAAGVEPPSPSSYSVHRLPARMTGSRPPRLW